MFLIAVLYLLLHLIAVFTYSPLLWGIDSWAYYNYFSVMLFLFAGLIFIVPGIRQKTASILKKYERSASRIPFWLLITISAIIMLLLSQDTYFLGDGLLRISDTERGIFFSGAEPMDTFIHNTLYYGINALIFDDRAEWFSGELIYRLISILCGILLIFSIRKYYTSRIEDKSNGDALIMGLVLFTAGFAQLFFGYVESYTVLALVFVLYLFATISMLREKHSSYKPSFYFAFGIILHPVAALLFPSLVYSYSKLPGNRKKDLIIKVLAVPFVFVALLLLVFNWGGLSPAGILRAYSEKSRLLPVFTNEEYYGILSLEHFIDIINQILLVFPALIALPLLKAKNSGIPGAVNTFLLLCTLLMFIPLVIMKPELGFARDWDLFTLFAVPLSVLAAIVLINQKENRFMKSMMVIGISLVHSLPWIYLNSDGLMSAKRAENLASTEHWAGYAKSLLYNDLSRYYYNKKNLEKALELSEKSYEYEQNPRFLWSLASLAEKTGRVDKAIKYFTLLSNDQKYKPDALAKLADLHMGIEDYVKAKDVLIQILGYEQDNPKLYFMLGVSFVKINDFDNALKAFKNAKNIDSSANMAIANLAEIASDSRKYGEAGKYYKILLDLEPENPILNFNLATILFYQKEYSLSEEYIAKAEKLGFDTSLIKSLRKDIIKDSLSDKR